MIGRTLHSASCFHASKSSWSTELLVLAALPHFNAAPLSDPCYICRTWLLDALQSMLYQLIKGLAHCHKHGVMHRDLKPQNLLVDDQTMTLKVADLGLGRAFSIPVKSYTHEARGRAGIAYTVPQRRSTHTHAHNNPVLNRASSSMVSRARQGKVSCRRGTTAAAYG
eukprot:GHRQ01020306.1.p1 GENE.GHRQ01020306.1~~GHRQ01020306.1.p1  ORF type:complete len:167 (+),score=42.42 GHRQ01020306.1:645-1145(+)